MIPMSGQRSRRARSYSTSAYTLAIIKASDERLAMPRSKDPWVPTILGHAILQLLSRNTASGYDLKGRFHGSVGHGWHAYDTQIYRELRSLEKEGFVAGRMAPGRSGPQRRPGVPCVLADVAARRHQDQGRVLLAGLER